MTFINRPIGFLHQLPYRELTPEEREVAWVVARKHGIHVGDEKIWKSTREEGLKMIDRVRRMGYEVTNPEEWSHGPAEGWGEASGIYSAGGQIGRIATWECGGFISTPISVHIPDFDAGNVLIVEGIKSAFGLADRLKMENIAFELSPSLKEIEQKSLEVKREEDYLSHCLTEFRKYEKR